MKRARWIVLALLLAGCPGETPPSTGSSPVAPVASPATGASAASAAPTWEAQAERVAARLDEVVRKVEDGDRSAALVAWEKAYFEEYESTQGRNLEVASRAHLPDELFEGKMRNVVQPREDAFGQIKSAVRAGAPVERVRSLVASLSAKIRDDAKKLDAMKAPP